MSPKCLKMQGNKHKIIKNYLKILKNASSQLGHFLMHLRNHRCRREITAATRLYRDRVAACGPLNN